MISICRISFTEKRLGECSPGGELVSAPGIPKGGIVLAGLMGRRGESLHRFRVPRLEEAICYAALV